MDEFALIAELFAPLSGAGSFGLKDDAATISPRAGFDLIVTTDTIAEGVDFFATDPPRTIAKKALRVNLSDLAAKGAAATSYLLNLTLPPHIEMPWLREFARGLGEDQEHYEIGLLGGDTGAGPLSITVTAFGYVPVGTIIKRSGAKPGDAIYVTGTVGDAGGGLAVMRAEEADGLSAEHRNYLIDRYRLPAPPVWFGPLLRNLATSALDVSDGLIADLGHLGETSGVRIVVEGRAIPRSPTLHALWGEDAAAILRAATAGDDYQIAFTADPAREHDIMAAAERAGTSVARIGEVTVGSGVALMFEGAELPVARPGYRHF